MIAEVTVENTSKPDEGALTLRSDRFETVLGPGEKFVFDLDKELTVEFLPDKDCWARVSNRSGKGQLGFVMHTWAHPDVTVSFPRNMWFGIRVDEPFTGAHAYNFVPAEVSWESDEARLIRAG